LTAQVYAKNLTSEADFPISPAPKADPFQGRRPWRRSAHINLARLSESAATAFAHAKRRRAAAKSWTAAAPTVARSSRP